MRTVVVGRTLMALVAAVGLASSGGTVAAAHGWGARALTCTGGEIGSGRYSSITVAGVCSVAKDAVVKVAGDITLRKGASLDAQSSPSTIRVGGNVVAHRGSTLGLGCQPRAVTGNSAHPCVDAQGNPIEDPSVFSTITVKGNVAAFGASVVLINGIEVGKNVTILQTGGGNAGGGNLLTNLLGGLPGLAKELDVQSEVLNGTTFNDTVAGLINAIKGNTPAIAETAQDLSLPTSESDDSK